MGSSRHRRNGFHGKRESTRGTRRDRRWCSRDARFPAVALTIALLLAACGGRARPAQAAPPAEPQVDFTTIDSPSLQFLPRHEEAAGWRLEEDPLVVPGNRIGMYLGADGAHFARYEVIDVAAGKYTALEGSGFAIVEIFRFPDFVKAFGAYSMRKEAARRFVPIENEGYVSKFAVHVWRGPFYIRVTGGATSAADALTSLASFVASRMPAAPSRPAVFGFFPSDARVPNSERYSADTGFGQKILGNSFQATFDVAGEKVEGLIIPAANKATATRILDAYRALYVRNGKLLDMVPNLGEDNFTAEERYLGRAVAYRIDRFVIAFNGYQDRSALIDLAVATDARILASIRKQLVTAEAAAAEVAPPREAPANPNQPPGDAPTQD